MKALAAVVALLTSSVLFASVGPARQEPSSSTQLVVHEWGTFTSVAGEDGRAVRWLPLDGPTDLPCFIEQAPYVRSKGALFATVRMETPVVYFYSPIETTVDLDVRFPEGLITEYFPHASLEAGTIAWTSVRVMPNGPADFPVEQTPSHYYAARETNAAPLRLHGQTERFLFYRGVGSFPLPLAATLDDEDAITVTNLGRDGIEHVVLFENRAGKTGYRIVDLTRGSATVPPPRLDGDVSSLRADLERMLTSHGLYPREAAAMVETWRDSWFEEGTRLFYVVPERAIASILPLRVTPHPTETVRVFVGRLEVITPAMLQDAVDAFETLDLEALEKYGRFLQPIATRLLGSPIAPPTRAMIQQRLDAASVTPPAAQPSDRCAPPAAPGGNTRPSPRVQSTSQPARW